VADVERALLSKAISTGEFPELVARGVEEEHFVDETCQELFVYANEFMTLHGAPPSMSAVKEEFPEFKTKLSADPLSYHMERFILKVKERVAIDGVREFMDDIEDPEALIDIETRAMDFARRLVEVMPAPRAARFSDMEHRIAEYKRREKLGINHGIFLGIPSLDEEMLGIQPHELVVIAAYLGVGKSTLMKFISHAAWLQNKTSLFISLEEETEAVLRKIDVMASNVQYWAMKALELGVGDLEKWKQLAERAHQDRNERDIIVRDDIANCSVDKVANEIVRYKPDMVFVDYLELMTTPRSAGHQHWETISYSGQGLKQLARLFKIPIVTAAQLNRDGGKGDVNLSNVSHQSVGKHADVLIGLRQTEEMIEDNEMDAILMKNRDGKKTRAVMNWQYDRMKIWEKGTDEMFPKRKAGKSSMISSTRRRSQKLEVARATDGIANPFSAVKRNRGDSRGDKNKARRPRRTKS
jgi:replicative DNA helicase